MMRSRFPDAAQSSSALELSRIPRSHSPVLLQSSLPLVSSSLAPPISPLSPEQLLVAVVFVGTVLAYVPSFSTSCHLYCLRIPGRPRLFSFISRSRRRLAMVSLCTPPSQITSAIAATLKHTMLHETVHLHLTCPHISLASLIALCVRSLAFSRPLVTRSLLVTHHSSCSPFIALLSSTQNRAHRSRSVTKQILSPVSLILPCAVALV